MKLHVFQHVPFEGLGRIETWAKAQKWEISATSFWNSDPKPDIPSIDFLVVMGGPMNIYEESRYPWLALEKRWIEEAIKKNKKVLGVCLGAQLIADVLGGKVTKNPYKEIGWFPVQWTAEARQSKILGDIPETCVVFHWHGDTFNLPSGAIHLAKSKACQNQAFLYQEHVLGLQFHMETNAECVDRLVQNAADELVPGPYIQSKESLLTEKRFFQPLAGACDKMLDAFLEPVKSRSF